MLSVQNYRMTPNVVSFKAQKENQTESKPFKTHAGLKTGVGCAVAEGAMTGFLVSGLTRGINALKGQEDEILDIVASGMKESRNVLLLLYLPVMALTALGCGALVDNKINKKNAELAEKVKLNGKREVLKNEKNANITKNENVYYKSNDGKKLGTILGVVAMPLLAFVQARKLNVLSAGISAALGAVGGLILGAITDACANRSAAKHADRQAVINL